MLIAVDIETIVEPGKGISQSEIEAWHKNYVPKKEYKKQETIDKHREADLEKWIKRQTLKAGRLKIIAMGLGRVHPFNFELQDVECLVSSNSKDIADFYCKYVEATHNAKGFLGYNVELFDLLHICQLLNEQNTPLDSMLKVTRYRVIDPCVYPLKFKYKLKDICRAFGIEHDDDELELLDGSDIQKLWDADNHEMIKRYCELDIFRVAKLTKALSRIWRLVD